MRVCRSTEKARQAHVHLSEDVTVEETAENETLFRWIPIELVRLRMRIEDRDWLINLDKKRYGW